MLYKITTGTELDFVRINPKSGIEEIRSAVVIALPDKKNSKAKVRFQDNHKTAYFLMDTLKRCKRHQKIKDKQTSALQMAFTILEKENRPIHIDELISLILRDGYEIPRGGKTFKNTLSTTLNNACSKAMPKIKKVLPAIYADINCHIPYKNGIPSYIEKDMEKAFV